MSFLSQFDAFHERVVKESGGLKDFGETDYVEPMKLMLSSVDQHSHFSPLGGQFFSSSICSNLVGRLFAIHGFKSHPENVEASIHRPIIIIGTMRTGTTALLTLLSKDPENQGLEHWLAKTPMPRPPRDTWETNPWFNKSKQELEQFYEIVPIRDAHPMWVDQADECTWALNQTMWAVQQTTFITAPEYLEWCLNTDARYAYRYFRKVLGLIAGGNPKRWVLKSPVHLWGLDALLDVFPDACVVFTHRDIMTSMTSIASMYYQIRHPIEPHLTQAQIGRQLMIDWGRAMDKAEKVRRKHSPSRFFDVHINQLQSDPIGTVERIYQYFDIPLSEQSRQLLLQQVKSDPRAGHGVRNYKAEDFGLTQEEVLASVGEYNERLNGLDKLGKP